jgi:tRNA nucleotidyltransferase/poly(A) polymerase
LTTIQQLAEVQSIIREVTGYSATVAGGAVRDLRLGKPIKDIDVLIQRSRDEDVYTDHEQRYVAKIAGAALQRKTFTGNLNTDLEGFRVTNESEYPDGEQVYATYEVDTDYGTVNLIFVSDLRAALNEFPDTLAQAMLLDDGRPYYSEEFNRSVAEKVVYHRLAEDTKRLPRMREKFPEYLWERVAEHAEALEWA